MHGIIAKTKEMKLDKSNVILLNPSIFCYIILDFANLESLRAAAVWLERTLDRFPVPVCRPQAWFWTVGGNWNECKGCVFVQ